MYYSKKNGAINIVSLDELFENSKDPIGLIKMDIEGYELPAIGGAKNIIRKFTPTLMISLYHKGQDFFEIPKIIKKIEPAYNLRFVNIIGYLTPFAERILLAEFYGQK